MIVRKTDALRRPIRPIAGRLSILTPPHGRMCYRGPATAGSHKSESLRNPGRFSLKVGAHGVPQVTHGLEAE